MGPLAFTLPWARLPGSRASIGQRTVDTLKPGSNTEIEIGEMSTCCLELPDPILGPCELIVRHSLSILCFIFVRLAFHTPEMLTVSFAKFETSDYSVSSSPFIKCTARLVLASFREPSCFPFFHLRSTCSSLTLCSHPASCSCRTLPIYL